MSRSNRYSMSKPVNKEEFWKQRLDEAERLEDSVYVTVDGDWNNINRAHEEILKPYINKKVLDAGCGYGRWSEFFPNYTGVDFSPDFIGVAKQLYPDKEFIQAQIEELPFKDKEFDLAFCVSVKVMIEANLGGEAWQKMEKELRRVAKEVILLEYTNPKEYEQIGD